MTSAVLDALREQPGGEELLAVAAAGVDSGAVHLVGGSVRDLLRGVAPRELDVVVEGQIEPLLEALGGEQVVHDRFGTASTSLDGARIDVTMSRRERYPHPGALPEVEPAPLAEDLLRRDFTVNAIAVTLPEGEMSAATHAYEDLDAGLLRVLHEQSFIDDPTRLWRLGRYGARLGFDAEPATAVLARDALASGALQTLSGTRIGAELRLALGEEDPLATLLTLRDLGVLQAAGLGGELDEPLLREALAMLPVDGRPDVLLLAALLAGSAIDGEPDTRRAEDAGEIAPLLDHLGFAAAERDRTLATVLVLPGLARELPESRRASELYELAAPAPLEAVALAGAIGARHDAAARDAAGRWLRELRNVRLQINGDDLIAAGIPEGPEVGRRLRAALGMRLDGELGDGRDAELQAALEA